MEPYVQESKKQYALVLVLIPEDIWNAQLNLPRNFARNFLDSIKRHDKELIALNPCTFLCSAEILSRLLPALSETAKVYDVETQILFLDYKPSWITS